MRPFGVFAQNTPAVPPVTVQLSDFTVYQSATLGTATPTYSIVNTGAVASQAGTLENWLTSGTASNYEVRATVTSGTLTSGTSGSWLSCGTTRTWTKSNGAQDNSVLTCVMTVEIRLASTGVVQDSATITLSAESDNLN